MTRPINAPLEPPRPSRWARLDWGLVGFCAFAGALELLVGAGIAGAI